MKNVPGTTRRRRLSPLALALFLALVRTAWGAPAAEAPDRIRIGLIPEINIFEQMERYKPLGAYIEKATGTSIRFTILSRYGNIIDRFNSMRLGGAFFGSFTGAMAIEKLGLEPIARPVNLDGESTYYGLIFVRHDSGIRSVSDLRDKRFAFVERATTAGYIFPLAHLRRAGVTDLDTYFSEYYFAGSHDATIYDVYNGLADGGAAKNTIFQRIIARSPEVTRALRILVTSEKVPSNGLCLSPAIPESFRKRVRELLLGMDQTPEGRHVLRILGAVRFVRTTRADYRPVFELAREAGISVKDYSYLNK